MDNNEIQIRFVPIELLEYNEGQIPGVPENPRTREDAKQRNLQKSIKELPEMAVARPALCFPYKGKIIVIGGNRRLEAQRALKRKELGGQSYYDITGGRFDFRKYVEFTHGEILKGFQLRYIYFIDKSYRKRLTVPEIPFSKIDEMGAGMYKGEKITQAERHEKKTIENGKI